jgi:hypothetical protein
MGWFRPVHAKSPGSQEVRALLVARKLLQAKLLDVEFSIRDTTVPVLAKGKTITGRLWTYVRADRPFAGTGPAGRGTPSWPGLPRLHTVSPRFGIIDEHARASPDG